MALAAGEELVEALSRLRSLEENFLRGVVRALVPVRQRPERRNGVHLADVGRHLLDLLPQLCRVGDAFAAKACLVVLVKRQTRPQNIMCCVRNMNT